MAKNLDVAYDVVETTAEDFLHDNYIDFSYYTITSRALTRVDGLKPVQRRIIYYMYKAGITSNKGTVKTQRVAGNITGNYHPHGDCLRFNTLFPLSNGEYKKIGEMYEETLKNPNKTYESYSIDKKGDIKLSTISNVRIGQKTKEIYKIHLSSGETIECTNNHPFMILNGDFVKAEDLEKGLVLTSATKFNHEVDPTFYLTKCNESKKVSYELFSIAKDEMRDLEENEIVHHIDHNRQNNSLENLQIMTRAEHAEHHKDYYKGLQNGLNTMFSGEHKEIREGVANKNKEIFKIFNNNQAFYKTRTVIRKMKEEGLELTNESYMDNKQELCYNAPTIDKLIEKGYIKKDINEFVMDREDLPEDLYFDFKDATGLVPKKEKKQKHIVKLDSEDLSYICSLNKKSLQFENKKYINEFDLNKVQNFIDKNNLIYITKIEIEHLEEEEPMYDFTVEGYENALIYFPNTESLICAHNSSVAESMANLAQKHNMRIPLILAEGNVGEFTGDKAAAPRYWEAKLSKEAELLVEEIKDGAAPLVPTFDDENVEPLVLPVKWPTAIINGTEGIAVGYASKMFPHNPTEVMDACIAFVRDRDFDYKDVMKYIKGPDFPTGGTIIGTDGIEKYMETGSGTFIVRGTYKIEPLSRGRNQIVFTELPYKISSMQIIEDIRKRQKDGEFKEISEVKELSDVNGSNLSITVKSGGNVEKVLEDLFKRTRLESRMSTNNTVLIDNRPYVASMPEMIKDFLNHRESCILNRTEHGLINLRNNEMRLAGMLKVLVDIDKTIEIVRSSRNRNSARNKLKKEFKINDEQANVILNMSLGRLTKSDSVEIEKQREEILKKIEEYEDLIENKDSLHDVMEKELKEIKNIIKDDRRTVIIDKTVKELKEDQKERQKVMKLVSANSPVKIAVYNDNSIQMILDENVPTDARDIIDTNSKDTLVGVTKNGKFVEVLVHSVSIENPDHSFKDLIGFAKASPKKDNKGLFFATNKGNVSIVKGNLKAADEGIKLDEGEEIIFAKNISNEEYKKELVIMISENSKIIKFPVSNINGFNQGAGSVIGMNTKGENVIFASTLTEDVNILAENNESQILVSTEEVPEQKRGGQGVKLVNTKKKEEGPKSAKIYNDTDIQVSKRGSAWKKK